MNYNSTLMCTIMT